MKKISSYIILAAAALMSLTVTTGCEGEGVQQNFIIPEAAVSGITPAEGYQGSQIAILGTNFGNRTEPVNVWINELECEVLACKDNMIVARIPEGAESGKVSLKIWNMTFEEFADFRVIENPVITEVYTNNPSCKMFAKKGDIITVEGKNFGTDKSRCEITIGNAIAPVLTLTDTQITCEAPEGFGFGQISLSIRGHVTKGGRVLDPATTGDLTEYALINSVPPFKMTEDVGIGDYYIPAESWLYNDASFTMENGMKTLIRPFIKDRNYPDGAFAFSNWPNFHNPGFLNAKMYQNVVLPAGTYRFRLLVPECQYAGNGNPKTLECFFAVSRGADTLPDLKGTPGQEGWTFVSEDAFFNTPDGKGKSYVCTSARRNFRELPTPEEYKLEVEIEHDTMVSIGFVNYIVGGLIFYYSVEVERLK